MTSLNCVDEILIRLSDCCVRILWVKFVVHGHKTILKTFTKVYWSLLSKHITLSLLSCVPGACPARYSLISCLIWLILLTSDTHTEVCLLLLKNAFELCLFASFSARIDSLLVLYHWVVSGWMFAEDKVCPSELIDMLLPLLFGIERSFLEISTVDLLLKANVCHIFLLY